MSLSDKKQSFAYGNCHEEDWTEGFDIDDIKRAVKELIDELKELRVWHTQVIIDKIERMFGKELCE